MRFLLGGVRRFQPSTSLSRAITTSWETRVVAEREHPPSFAEADDGWKENLRGEDWLTGQRPREWFCVHPSVAPGFREETGVLSSLPQLRLNRAGRREVNDYFLNGWSLSEWVEGGAKGAVIEAGLMSALDEIHQKHQAEL